MVATLNDGFRAAVVAWPSSIDPIDFRCDARMRGSRDSLPNSIEEPAGNVNTNASWSSECVPLDSIAILVLSRKVTFHGSLLGGIIPLSTFPTIPAGPISFSAPVRATGAESIEIPAVFAIDSRSLGSFTSKSNCKSLGALTLSMSNDTKGCLTSKLLNLNGKSTIVPRIALTIVIFFCPRLLFSHICSPVVVVGPSWGETSTRIQGCQVVAGGIRDAGQRIFTI